MKDYKGITENTKQLLNRGEDKYVDYKDRLKGLDAEDLVAFANSTNGGVILIGVKEVKNEKGMQIGVPCGCQIGDDYKLQIISKALSCSPPVQIIISVENLSDKPFYKIEIPSSSTKPHSTNSGTYKIREDGRNNPLLPEQLLKLFLDRESEEFKSRFSNATTQLEIKMKETLSLIGDLESAISSKIEDISSNVGLAEYEAENAKSKINVVEGIVESIDSKMDHTQARLKEIFKHLGVIDPVIVKAKKEVLEYLQKEFENDKELLKKVKNSGSIELSGSNISLLDKKELSEILTEVIKKVESKE